MSQTNRHSASPVDEHGVVRCYFHDSPTAEFTSHTQKNPNRKFYKCVQAEPCNFFAWVDTVIPPTPSQSSSTMSSPLKRQRSPSSSQVPVTPSRTVLNFQPQTNTQESKQKRLQNIQLAMAATPTKSKKPENVDEFDQFDDIDDSFFSSPEPSQSQSFHSSSNYSMSPTKKPRFGSPDAETVDDWSQTQSQSRSPQQLLTPPQTTLKSRSQSLALSNGKDAARNSVKADEEENPFISKLPVLSLAAVPFSLDTNLSSESTNVLTQLASHVRQLERQKAAAIASRDVKSRRIEELQEKVKSLDTQTKTLSHKNRQLEELVGTLKAMIKK